MPTCAPATCRRRGKHNQKHYTVFVAALDPRDRAGFQPQLNHEHCESRWWSWGELVGGGAPPLHPVVHQLLKGAPRQELAAALPLWGDAPDNKKKHRVEKRGSGLLFVYEPIDPCVHPPHGCCACVGLRMATWCACWLGCFCCTKISSA